MASSEICKIEKTMKDYYKILGIHEEASQEEIRERWAELTHKYHPDRVKDGNGERIKEINEAYQVLKDPATRFDYDFNRDLKKSVLKKKEYGKRKRNARLNKVLPPVAIAVVLLGLGSLFFFSKSQGPTQKAERHPIVPSKSETSVQNEKEIPPMPPAEPAAQETAKAVPKPYVSVPPSASSKEAPPKVTIPPVSKPEESVRIEREIARKPAKKEDLALSPALREDAVKEKVIPPVALRPAEPVRVAEKIAKEPAKKEATPVAPALRDTPPKESPPVVSKPEVQEKREELPPVGRQIPKEVAEKVSSGPAPAEPSQIPPVLPVPPKPVETAKPVGETPREPIRTMPPQKPSVASGEMAKVEVPKPTPSGPPRTAAPLVPVPPPAPKPEESVKIVRDVPKETVPPPLAKEEEVIEFLTRYVNQYVGKDVERFLSFFSPQVVQNQRFDYNAIKNMYTKFFEESQKLKYRVKPETIEISPSEAKVRGTYRIEQETKSGQNKMWAGNIEWTLIREQGTLKVRTLQYQHTQKP